MTLTEYVNKLKADAADCRAQSSSANGSDAFIWSYISSQLELVAKTTQFAIQHEKLHEAFIHTKRPYKIPIDFSDNVSPEDMKQFADEIRGKK